MLCDKQPNERRNKMTIKDGYAALTSNGEVIYEQGFTAIVAPSLGIESEATVVWRKPPTEPKPKKAKKAVNDCQMELF